MINNVANRVVNNVANSVVNNVANSVVNNVANSVSRVSRVVGPCQSELEKVLYLHFIKFALP